MAIHLEMEDHHNCRSTLFDMGCADLKAIIFDSHSNGSMTSSHDSEHWSVFEKTLVAQACCSTTMQLTTHQVHTL